MDGVKGLQSVCEENRGGQDAGATIGEPLPKRISDQRAVVKAIDEAATRGRQMRRRRSPSRFAWACVRTPEGTNVQNTLFGDIEETRSLVSEIGELSDYVRKTLGEEKRTLGTVAKSKRSRVQIPASNRRRIASESRMSLRHPRLHRFR
jgi:hypothetical protein